MRHHPALKCRYMHMYMVIVRQARKNLGKNLNKWSEEEGANILSPEPLLQA